MDSFVGAIFSFGFNFAPYGWAQCNGDLLPISGNEALYSLLGTTYGGDGTTTFALPNMQGRVPIGTGQGPGLPNYVIGQAAGSETVTLSTANLPVHSHAVLSASIPVGTTTDSNDPTGHYFAPVAPSGAGSVYDPANGANMATNNTTSGTTGSSIPMSILSPFLVVNYCISLFGIYPSRN